MSRAAEIAAEFNAAMGEGTIRLGSDPSLSLVQVPTGCIPFDVITGGGVPLGRSIELFGGFSVLKSLFCLRAIAAFQAAGMTAALVDTEHVYDPEWATEQGVDTSSLLVQYPKRGEDAIKVGTTLIKNKIDLLVIDSVAGLFPKAYEEAEPGSSGDEKPARLAAMMSKGLARMTAANEHTAMIFTNQTRETISAMSFGPRDKATGGRALPFYASMRVKLTKAGQVRVADSTFDGEKIISTRKTIGMKIKAEVEKSKLNKPYREVWFTYDLTHQDIDDIGFLMAQGIELGLITKKGKSSWEIPDIMDGSVNGLPKLHKWIAEDDEVVEWLHEKVMESHMG